MTSQAYILRKIGYILLLLDNCVIYGVEFGSARHAYLSYWVIEQGPFSVKSGYVYTSLA